jgi:large subunit ribosomal protein L29
MSTLTAKDLRGNEPEELRATIKKLQEDLFKNRMKSVTNQLENTMLLRHARRDIARVNTVLTEKARATVVAKPATQATTSAPTGSKSPKAAQAGKAGAKADRASRASRASRVSKEK